MYRVITISRVLVAGIAVWRLTNSLFEDSSYGGRSRLFGRQPENTPENLLGNRILDCLCWLSIWLSAQTAIWIAGGLAGVLLNWLLLSSISRLFVSAVETPEDSLRGLRATAERRADAGKSDFSSLPVEATMQAHHG